MNAKWEISRVSTPERILEKIKKELAQPVGIILFGADCDFKKEVVKTFTTEFGDDLACDTYAGTTMRHIQQSFGASRNYMIDLDSTDSASHDIRHQCVLNLRNLGARSVVGIYIKAREISEITVPPLSNAVKQSKFNNQIHAIEDSKPTSEGLDYLITVEERGNSNE